MAVVATLGFFGAQPTASATPPFYNCTGTSHCYSIGAAQNDYAGIEGQWNDNDLEIPASEAADIGHLNNEMWLINQDGGGFSWVEEGLMNSCTKQPTDGSTCSEAKGVQAYEQFWATGVNGGSGYYWHLIDTLTPDGDNHSYEIWDSSNTSNNNYGIYLDYNQIGTATDQSYPQGTSLQAGMELYSPPGDNSGEYAKTTFANAIEDYTNPRGSWAYVDFDPNTYESEPCGYDANCGLDDCTDFTSDVCMYWQRTSDSVWSDRKPG